MGFESVEVTYGVTVSVRDEALEASHTTTIYQ
jgi:hypothetical protein